MYHLKLFAFRKNSSTLLKILDKNERDLFIHAVKNLLNKIEDKYILVQNTKTLYIDFFLALKHDDETILPKRNCIDKINHNNAITITSKRLDGFSFVIDGYFSDENYILKNTDKIFAEFMGRKFFATPVNSGQNIKIWDIDVKGYFFVEFSIRLPVWCMFIQFGLLSKNRIIYLSKINLLEALLNKIQYIIKTMRNK